MNPATAEPRPSMTLAHEGWRILRFDTLESTNTTAARLPAWTAVRAQTQTAGRGRTGRAWVSDTGGLWLSAVVPCPGERVRWSILPLAAGWAILRALEELGATGLRLRWPNDIMVGRRKLAGLLVERYTDDTAVVGIGINVANQPEAAAPDLEGATARLADLVRHGADLDRVERLVLRALQSAHRTIATDGFRAIADELNAGWSSPRRVEITLAGREYTFEGTFLGVDQHGRLQLATARDGVRAYAASDINLLREID